MAEQVVIEVADLHKGFLVPRPEQRSVRHPAGLIASGKRRLEVLRGVDLKVRRGESFGVAGRNGSGKSTLLKVIAGIYEPDSGRVEVKGRIGPVLDLGVGFNPELPTRENALINAVMLGLSRREARERIDRILDFAELNDFAEARLKNLSTGMRARLAFATMIESEPEVLLIDEVLSVGDQRFQDRCAEALERFRANGRTIVLVTHSMSAMEGICDRAVLIEGGVIDQAGSPGAIAARYSQVNALAPSEAGAAPRRAVIEAVRLEGDESGSVDPGEPIRLRVELLAERPLDAPSLKLEVRNARGARIFVSDEVPLSPAPGELLQVGKHAVAVELENRLTDGRFVVLCSLACVGNEGRTVAASDVATLEIQVGRDDSRTRGFVKLGLVATLEKDAARVEP